MIGDGDDVMNYALASGDLDTLILVTVAAVLLGALWAAFIKWPPK